MHGNNFLFSNSLSLTINIGVILFLNVDVFQPAKQYLYVFQKKCLLKKQLRRNADRFAKRS